MRAIVYERYGKPEVLEVRELPSPVPGPREVCLTVGAAALNPKDSFMRKGRFRVTTLGRSLHGVGFDVAGRVKAVGAQVTRFAVGDAVFGMRNGFRGGTVAEEVRLTEGELAKKPARLSFDEAAAIPRAAPGAR